MNKLHQVEMIVGATVAALRRLGLGGFEVAVKFYDHYDNREWQNLAAEASGRYRYRGFESADVLESKESDAPLDRGQGTITIFVPNGYQAILKEQEQVVTEHAAAMKVIVANEGDEAEQMFRDHQAMKEAHRAVYGE